MSEKYQPKEGDVIERGRRRIIIGGHGLFRKRYVTYYRRAWLSGEWTPDIFGGNYSRDSAELAAMVNHMGWRVLP